MIYIEKNTTNQIALELSCLIPSTYIYFLFEFIFDSNPNKEVRYFTTNDISLATCRFNLFEIIESNLGSTTTNNINPIQLEPGQYKYKIYAGELPVDYLDLTPYLSTEPISIGKMVVEGDNVLIVPVYDSQNVDNTSPSVYR